MQTMRVLSCSCCNNALTPDRTHSLGHEPLCPDCFDEETVLCSRCDVRIWQDDNMGNDDTPLCGRCYDYHYTTCADCGRLLHNDDVMRFDDSDDGYCAHCYDARDDERNIQDYNYKPEPTFFGNGNRFYGVELEIDEGGKDEDNAAALLDIGNCDDEHIYIKGDGSLNRGLEIVTHPMTLDYHSHSMPWRDIMQSALDMGYRSHKTDTCGLHIHVNRCSFSDNRDAQDDHISRVLFIVERFWEELLRFSRRTEDQLQRWAARYGYKAHPKQILAEAKDQESNRYLCVNIGNYHTIEFRMFRGTLKYNTLIATLQLVDEICNMAISLSDAQILKLGRVLKLR